MDAKPIRVGMEVSLFLIVVRYRGKEQTYTRQRDRVASKVAHNPEEEIDVCLF